MRVIKRASTVFIYVRKAPVATTLAELLPLNAYIGVGECARHTRHLQRAELKLGEDVSTRNERIC